MFEFKNEEDRKWVTEHWPDFDAYYNDLSKAEGSERVLMLVGSLMLDLILRRLLVAFFVDEDDEVIRRLVGKEDSAGDLPLSSFSARIKACRALGLIDTYEFKALDQIREIRNAFAHRLSENISEQSLDARANNLLGCVASEDVQNKQRGQSREYLLQWSLVRLSVCLSSRLRHVKRLAPWVGTTCRDWHL